MLHKFALRNAMRNKRRSLVAMLTVLIGSFGLMIIQSFFTGLLNMHAENAIRSRYGHGQIMRKGYWDQSFERPSDHWLEISSDELAQWRSQAEVQDVYPRVQFFAMLQKSSISVAGRGQGIDGEREKNFFDRMNFVKGAHIGAQADGIVLGIGLAKALAVDIGDQVTVVGMTVHGTVNAIDVRVAGIFHVGMKEADDTLFQVQLSQAQSLLDTSKFETIAVALKDEKDWDKFSNQTSQRYPHLTAISVYDLDKAWARNGKDFLTALMNLFKFCFVGVIIFSIYNTSASMIVERTREFGMLRANGERPIDLIKLIGIESSMIAAAGVILGMVLLTVCVVVFGNGITMPPTPGTTRAIPVPLQIELVDLISAASLSFVCAIGASLVSSARVMRMRIVASLRYAA